MKNLLPYFALALSFTAVAQEHFSGINTSRRVGVLNVTVNPAELANLTSNYEVNLFSTSLSISNNVIGLNDISGDKKLEDLIYNDGKPVNLRLDAQFQGPSFATKQGKWAYALNTNAYVKMSVVDLDSNLGKAIDAQALNKDGGTLLIKNDYNQRVIGTAWGELGLSVARSVFDIANHKITAGATLKLLFPGSYANIGVDKFSGTVKNIGGDMYLQNSNANINIAYSGNLAGNLENNQSYFSSIFGSPNGVAADIGATYQFKDDTSHRVKVGLSVKNIGGMTFKSDNNSSTNYKLAINGSNSLALKDFSNSQSIEDVEKKLISTGYLDKTVKDKVDFKVNLPTLFTAYADFRVYEKFFMTLYTQQKVNSDNNNDQITTQNVLSLTPRISFKNYEVYSTWASNEISGTTGGFGFRICGFYLGSSSIFTVLTNSTKQADFYMGFAFGV